MIIETYHDLLIVLIQSSILFMIYFLMYRKYVYSIFDPLFFFIVTQAFSTELAILTMSDNGYLANFIACQLCFIIGFRAALSGFSQNDRIINKPFILPANYLKLLKHYCLLGFLLILVVNFYFFLQKGVILFSDDPTTSKVTDFEGGLGFVKRINWGLLPLISITSIFLLIYSSEIKYIFITVILLILTLLGGGKGAILSYLYAISLFGIFSSFKNMTYYKYLDKIKIPIGVLGSIIALYIFSTTSEDFEKTIVAAGIRFLYFGDIIFYYYEPDSVKHFQQLGFLDFINREFNSILGLLRLTSYTNPLGYEMVVYSLNLNMEQYDIIKGPNAPFYVKGHIFFGWFGGLIYSLFVGTFVGYIRKKLFKFNNNENVSIYVLGIIFINTIIFSFPQDSALFISVIFDTLIFSLIPFLLALLFTTKINFNSDTGV